MTKPDIQFIAELEAVIVDRAAADTDESYTARLVAEGPKRVAQKVGEEAVELALAAVAGDRAEMVDEAADLIYHMLVLLHVKDAGLADVAAVLRERHGG